jgi:hypothetical protein
MTSHNARQLLNAPALSPKQIGEIFVAVPVEYHPQLVTVLDEIERLKWECAGWKGRCEMAREERDDIASRYWMLQMEKVPGGKV